MGRYLEPDPIGRASGQENIYAYTSNPLFRVDVDGLCAKITAPKKKPFRNPENLGDEEGTAEDSGASKKGETASTAKGKEVHKKLADERRVSGEWDLVNAPLIGANGEPIEVPYRVNMKGENAGAAADGRIQVARPDAVNFKKGIILNDKPAGRPISKDKQEINRFISAYEQSQGKPPKAIIITRYNPVTGEPEGTETYKPSFFRPEAPTPSGSN